MRVRLLSCGFVLGPVVRPCEHGNEPSGFNKREEFLRQLIEYQFLKNNSVPWSLLVRRILLHRLNQGIFMVLSCSSNYLTN
jgi:hypothetical protein